MPYLLAFFMAALMAATVGMAVMHSPLLPDTISEHGGTVDRQIILTCIITAIIMVLAHIGLAYAIVKFRSRQGHTARYMHGHNVFEITMMVLCLILFVGLNLMGQGVWAKMHLMEKPKDALAIEVNAQQFNWYFRYPGKNKEFDQRRPEWINDAQGNNLGLDSDDFDNDGTFSDDVVTNALVIPADRNILINIRSRDVIHSFNVVELRVKQDAVPGLEIPIPFMAQWAKMLKFKTTGNFKTELDGGKVPDALVNTFLSEGRIKLFQGASAEVKEPGKKWIVSNGDMPAAYRPDWTNGKDKPMDLKYMLIDNGGTLECYQITYEVACTELCGAGHYKMRSTLTILPPADYDAWYQKVVKDAAP